MAAHHSHRHSASRSIIERTRDDEVVLPDGSCGFRDLSNGRAPTCGCKRFWLNDNHFNGQHYCHCQHHACYHGLASAQSHITEPMRVEERRGSVGSPRIRDAGTEEMHVLGNNSSQTKPAGLGILSEPLDRSQSIDTRVWQALNQFARDQEDGAASRTSSKLPSTAVPSVAGDDIGLGYSHVQPERALQARPMGPPVTIPAHYVHPPEGEEYSATEVATPSIAGTPNMRAFLPPHSQARASPTGAGAARLAPPQIQSSHIRPTTETVANAHAQPPQQAWTAFGLSGMASRDVQNLLESYGRRIDVLENLSFNHIPPDELNDRFETIDGRFIDLEQWRIKKDQEKSSPELVQPPRNKRRRLLPTETSSFASDGSFDSNAAMHTEAAVLATLAANAETGPRIDALETRIADLEGSAPPSYARPWQVQVVLLPWGSELRGIWFSADGSTEHSIGSAREWSEARSGPRLSFKSSSNAVWTTESIQAWADETREWLSPKACGPSGTVFRRLESRGFVRDITITAPDARHIFDLINACFASFRQPGGKPATDRTDSFQGLTEDFIPLRKVRKSSRLRFLSPSEVVTSASWTASFLDASVLMKANAGRRLYITTRNAYSQPSGSSWSWPKVRELPLHAVDDGERAAQINLVAIEACWSYEERLDQTPNTHSSSSDDSSWSHESQQAGCQPDGRLQHLSPRSEARPLRERTVSMPSTNSAADQLKDTLTQRRVSSAEMVATVPLQTYGGFKRRRISTSPEAERKGVGLTPRWSREPPSPSTSGNALGEAQSPETSRKRRGNTPFAYATPHSNNTYVGGGVDLPEGDGDTEADLDLTNARSLNGEVEWQGVEDAATTQVQAFGNGDESAGDDVDIGDGSPCAG